jgi:iron-sulfur cluster repair protein YtfE (RIC family)
MKIIINKTGVTVSDPVRKLEHAHGHLTKLALDLRQLVHSDGRLNARDRKRLMAKLAALRNELFDHFANEEEGLFPFLRSNLPETAHTVDRLESAHDTICGAIVRLAHLTEQDGERAANRSALNAFYERFIVAYTEHSQTEAALFEELGRTLDEPLRAELASILRGL